MIRPVRVLTRAQQDIASCYAFLAERSPQGAADWFNRFEETRNRLASDAETRPLAPECHALAYQIREVDFKTRRGRRYRVLFTIYQEQVLILRVRGPGQDLVTDKDLPIASPELDPNDRS